MLSRVADSLFWMARNIERAENVARLVDTNLQMLLDLENHGADKARQYWSSVLASLEERDSFKELYGGDYTAENVIDFVVFQPENPSSIFSSLHIARENARSIRDAISAEMFEHVNRMYLFIRSPEARELFSLDEVQFYKRIIDGSYLFQGIAEATMMEGEGWQFMQIGKFLERADNTSRLVDIKYHLILPEEESVGGAVDTIQWMSVLKSCSAHQAFLTTNRGSVTVSSIVKFLCINPFFPRSTRFCVDSLDRALHKISGVSESYYSNEVERLAGKLRFDIGFLRVEDIFTQGLHQFCDQLQARLNEVAIALTAEYVNKEYAPKSQYQSQE
jgi:uncharacterized alpha-E superfamily protein